MGTKQAESRPRAPKAVLLNLFSKHEPFPAVFIGFVLSVTTVFVGCGEDIPQDKAPTGSASEIAIEGMFEVDTLGGWEYPFFDGGNVYAKLEDALSPIGQTVAYKTIKIHPSIQPNTNTWRTFRDLHKSDQDYRYCVACVQDVYDGTFLLTTETGVTLVPSAWQDSIGHDNDPDRPFSFLLWQNISYYVSSNGNDKRWWPFVFIHEMGHQRANLNEYSCLHTQYASQHQPIARHDGIYCVMHLMGSVEVACYTPITLDSIYGEVLSNLKFCGTSQDWDSSNASCLRYLEQRQKGPPP